MMGTDSHTSPLNPGKAAPAEQHSCWPTTTTRHGLDGGVMLRRLDPLCGRTYHAIHYRCWRGEHMPLLPPRASRFFLVLASSLLALLGAALFPQVAWSQTVSAAFNDAVQKIRSGDFRGGCTQAEKIAQSASDFYAVHNLLGMCAMQRGETQKAESFFRKSIQLNRQFAEARNNLAACLIQIGKGPEGKAQLIEVLKLRPDSVNALFNLGRIELADKAYHQATVHLSKANSLAPEDAQIQLSLAAALYGSRDDSTARKIIQTLIRAPQDSQVILQAALVALHFSDEGLAQEGLQRAVSLNPAVRTLLLSEARSLSEGQQYKSAGMLLDLLGESHKDSAEWNALSGYAAYKSGDPAKALERLRRAIELDPQVESYYLKIGELMLFYNSDKAAIAFFEAGLEKFPDSLLLNAATAMAYIARGADPKTCFKFLDKTLTLQPDFLPALSLNCQAAYQHKDWVRLSNAAERMLRFYPESYEGFYYKGVAVLEGQTDPLDSAAVKIAKESLEKSMRLNPRFVNSRIAWGSLLYRTGKIEEGIAELKRAAAMDPEGSQAHWHLAKAYQKAGLMDKRKAELAQWQPLHDKEEQKRHRSFLGIFEVIK